MTFQNHMKQTNNYFYYFKNHTEFNEVDLTFFYRWIRYTFVYLQEADSHENKAVRADPSSEDFIQISLQQELLQDEDQRWQNGVLLRDGKTEREKQTGHVCVERVKWFTFR